MGANDNLINPRGEGIWDIVVYQPADEVIKGIKGFLFVGKDFHIIYAEENMQHCLVNVPSQNVAYAINRA